MTVIDNVKDLIEAALDNPKELEVIASRSYAHVSNFYKIVLQTSAATELRVHVWEDGIGLDASEHFPHTHVQDFQSYILAGSFQENRFKFVPGDTHTIKNVDTLNPNGYVITNGETTGIQLSENRIYKAGDTYTCLKDVVHTIHPMEAGGITIVKMIESACDSLCHYYEPRPRCFFYSDKEVNKQRTNHKFLTVEKVTELLEYVLDTIKNMQLKKVI